MLSEDELSAAIELTPAPRVTKQQMLDRIASVEYVRVGLTVTICNITLDNGFSVRGESACVSPENFNEVIGNDIAYKAGFEKLWELFGFLLAEDTHRAKTFATNFINTGHQV